MARPESDLPLRLIAAARSRFLQHGVDGASLRRIAHDAGTSIGMVYYYFKTKDELFQAVVEDVYRTVLEDLRGVLQEESCLHARLAGLYTRLACMSDIEFDVARLILREALVSSDRLHHLAERFASGHLPLVLELLMDGRQTGELRQDVSAEAMLAGTFAMGVLPQLLRRALGQTALPAESLIPDAPALAEQLIKVLWGGVTAHAPSLCPEPALQEAGPDAPGSR